MLTIALVALEGTDSFSVHLLSCCILIDQVEGIRENRHKHGDKQRIRQASINDLHKSPSQLIRHLS